MFSYYCSRNLFVMDEEQTRLTEDVAGTIGGLRKDGMNETDLKTIEGLLHQVEHACRDYDIWDKVKAILNPFVFEKLKADKVFQDFLDPCYKVRKSIRDAWNKVVKNNGVGVDEFLSDMFDLFWSTESVFYN